jgi:hypothetical protein
MKFLSMFERKDMEKKKQGEREEKESPHFIVSCAKSRQDFFCSTHRYHTPLLQKLYSGPYPLYLYLTFHSIIFFLSFDIIKSSTDLC